MLVTTKVKVNFNLPPVVARFFDAISDERNGKQKWIVATTAILLLTELSPQARAVYYEAVGSADQAFNPEEAYEKLLALARTGKIRPRAIRAGGSAGAGPAKGKNHHQRSPAHE